MICVMKQSLKRIKALLRTNVLNDVTAAPLSVSFFTAGSWEKDIKNSAAVTSLRWFVHNSAFNCFVTNSSLKIVVNISTYLVNIISSNWHVCYLSCEKNMKKVPCYSRIHFTSLCFFRTKIQFYCHENKARKSSAL